MTCCRRLDNFEDKMNDDIEQIKLMLQQKQQQKSHEIQVQTRKTGRERTAPDSSNRSNNSTTLAADADEASLRLLIQ